MKSKIYTVKKLEEVWKIAPNDLGIQKDDLEANIIEDNKKELTVEVKTTADGVLKGRDFLQMLLIENQQGGAIEKRVRDNQISFNIEADEFNGVLIGKNSQHLRALQVIVETIINSYYNADEQKIVQIDVGEYKTRQIHRLERMAVQYAKEVAASKQKIELSNLNPYQRKIIHDKLSRSKNVFTHSEGEGLERKLIIEPKAE